MITPCLNPDCGKGVLVPDASFKFGSFRITCPHCKKKFRAGPTGKFTPEWVGQSVAIPPIASNQSNSGLTDILKKNKPRHRVTAWLEVTNEKGITQIHSLKPGKQLVGRKSGTKPCDIMIDTTDKKMGRNHFYIEAVNGASGGISFILYDNGSLNQTTILTEKGGFKVENDGKVILQDNYKIQAGLTVIVFRLTNEDNNPYNVEIAPIKPSPDSGFTEILHHHKN